MQNQTNNKFSHLVRIQGQFALYATPTPSLEDATHPIAYYDSKKDAKEASLAQGLKPWNF